MQRPNPLATARQADAERTALRLISHPEVRAARERARALLLKDPAARCRDGYLGLDRALDQWLLALSTREANGDPHDPAMIWNVDNTPRSWFGHTFPGAAVAIDNPDNVNREAVIDGDCVYNVRGQAGANGPLSFSLIVETAPEWLGGIGLNVATMMLKDIECATDGSFVVTLGKGPAAGRRNFMQIASGRLMLFTRDSFSDWSQTPIRLEIQQIEGPPSKGRAPDSELASRIAEHLQPFVASWLDFKNGFLNMPPPNTLVGPAGRPGGWGYLAGGTFALEADEALIITTRTGGGGYTGLQVTDPWTIAPDPVNRQTSLNITQALPNPDGSFTYVLSRQDPGLNNWIDIAGMQEGWLLLRWQAMPDGGGPEGLVQSVAKSRIDDLSRVLPAGVPAIDLAGRRAQIAARIRGRARLTEGTGQ